MPRVHIHVQDRDMFEEADEPEVWERQLGLDTAQRAAGRDIADGRSGGIRRFGGSEAVDRKRAERRKQSRRRR